MAFVVPGTQDIFRVGIVIASLFTYLPLNPELSSHQVILSGQVLCLALQCLLNLEKAMGY